MPGPAALLDETDTLVCSNAAFLEAARECGAELRPLLARLLGAGLDASEAACESGEALVNGTRVAFTRAAVAGLGWLCTLQKQPGPAIDELTGLPGRAEMRAAVEHGLRLGGRDRGVAYAMIDLDRFKAVNDTLGHAVGDRLLAKVAERLRSAVREGDMLARLGGDEFALVQIGDEQPAAIERTVARLVDLVGRPYVVDGQMLEIGCSVGVALAPGDATEADALASRADLALYRAKEEGRSCYRFFAPGMDDAMLERRALDADMRRALAYREFELHYQPQQDLPSGRITGFEALIRWNHPERGTVQPGDFIPLAEETGFIVPLGEWIVRQACADCASWPGAPSVAVNVSTRQLMGAGLVDTVRTALHANGLAPARLEVEVTETSLMEDTRQCVETLGRLRDLGVAVSLDDFGTGYSSISYLRSFPFDKLKIDKSFVHEEDGSSDDLVKAIIDISRHFRMNAVAEGVETEARAEALRSLGCNAIQGFLLGRAMPSDDARTIAERQAAAPDASSGSGAGAASRAGAVPALEDEGSLVRLAYVSRSTCDLSELDLRTQVTSILAVSRRNNGRDGVSGALLFNHGHFAQVLEGPSAAVEATFERIQHDDRHADVNLIECRAVTGRVFAGWAMAHVGADEPGRAGGLDLEGLASVADWTGGGVDVVSMLANLLRYEERHGRREAA